MKAIRVHSVGGPEVLKLEDIPVPEPAAGEAVVKVSVIGLNFIDVYYRTGLYKAPKFPFTPGMEAAGTVTAVGPNVSEIKVGDRVAWAMAMGAYAEYAAVVAWKLVKLPDNVDFEQGAAIMLQGMTAHYLSHSTFPLKSGHTALVHAGAGGVGLLLTQIARKLGATVYTTAGSEAKAELSRAAGANEVILYAKQDFEAEVKRLTGGKGVDVVYDSVGATTFDKSLNCLKPRAYMVLFGQSSGAVPAVDLNVLAPKGSLFVTRTSLNTYASSREEIVGRASDLFRWVGSGELKIRIGQKYALSDVAKAHEDLEGRRTTGKVVLIP
jgi:NADPH2:quinone reductase